MSAFRSIYFIGIVSLFSCYHPVKTDVFNQLNASINSSNEFISSNTKDEYYKLTGNLSNAMTRERAEVWKPKSDTIKKITLDLLKEINFIKNSSEETDKKKQFFLFSKMENFRGTILNLDAALYRTFSKSMDVLPSKEVWVDRIFSGKDKPEQTLLLGALQNKILRLENSVITFCRYQTEPSCNLHLDITSVIVGQNTTHLKAGEVLEINAGVGAFSSAADPVIHINGNIIPTVESVSHFKLRASNKIGKHYIPVEIDYLKEDGKRVSQKVEVEYYIDE